MQALHRLWDLLGANTDWDEFSADEADEMAGQNLDWQSFDARGAYPNVINLPGVSPVAEFVLFEPRSFTEVPQAILMLRDRKSVILNIQLMDPDEAQRSVDFVAGGAYAIDGHQERLGEYLFLFTPSFVQIRLPSRPESESR